MKKQLLILASASPRRVELLQQIQVKFEQQVADIDEIHRSDESPEQFVSRLATEKAQAVLDNNAEAHAVLGSDTIVVIDEHILGKPVDEAAAVKMLKMLSGRTHQVMTAVTLLAADTINTKLSISEVTFMEMGEELIRAYWKSGESSDKAGAYAVQGIAAQFITQINGSYSGIMGLPLYETRQLLEGAGFHVLGR